MKLYFYFARRFAANLLGLFLVFVMLSALIEMIEVLRKFDRSDVGFLEILRLTSLRLPRALYQILPLIVILATLTLFLNLAKSSELVVTRAAGRSALRSLVSPVIVVFLVGAFAVAVINPIVAATSKQYKILENRYSKGVQSVLSIGPEGLWLRQGSDSGQTVIRAEHTNADGTILYGVTFFGFDSESLNSYRIEAAQAELLPDFWKITDAKEWTFEYGENSERGAVTSKERMIATDLTKEQIRDGFGPPSTIPIWQMPAFIQRLERAGFSSRRHQMRLQTELATPFLLVTMVMIGAAFTMRHTRFGRTGIMVLAAIGMGFSIFFVRNFASILGENGQIPVLLAAWAPPAAGLLLALGLLLHLEDG